MVGSWAFPSFTDTFSGDKGFQSPSLPTQSWLSIWSNQKISWEVTPLGLTSTATRHRQVVPPAVQGTPRWASSPSVPLMQTPRIIYTALQSRGCVLAGEPDISQAPATPHSPTVMSLRHASLGQAGPDLHQSGYSSQGPSHPQRVDA